MSSGANLHGVNDILATIEKKLGEQSVNRIVNKAMRETASEIEPDFKEAISVYKDTGATVSAVAVSGISRVSGEAQIKLGFGKGEPTRWQLVHLNELGYEKNPNPRGRGVIRRFSEQLESVYPEKIAVKLKDGFSG